MTQILQKLTFALFYWYSKCEESHFQPISDQKHDDRRFKRLPFLENKYRYEVEICSFHTIFVKNDSSQCENDVNCVLRIDV